MAGRVRTRPLISLYLVARPLEIFHIFRTAVFMSVRTVMALMRSMLMSFRSSATVPFSVWIEAFKLARVAMIFGWVSRLDM